MHFVRYVIDSTTPPLFWTVDQEFDGTKSDSHNGSVPNYTSIWDGNQVDNLLDICQAFVMLLTQASVVHICQGNPVSVTPGFPDTL